MLRSNLRAVAVALLLAVLAAAPARAALFEDEEARKQVEATNKRLTELQNKLDGRIAALEGQLKSQGLVELFNQVELLKADTARLRGQLEVLTHQQNEVQKRQRDLYVDLDSRLRKLEAAPRPPAATAPAVPGEGAAPPVPSGQAVSAPAATATPGLPPAPAPAAAALPGGVPAGGTVAGRAAAADLAAEQRAYDAALTLFQDGNYAAAITRFTAFINANPGSPLSPSAQYWIGNARFAQKDFRAAVAAQRQLIAAYPDSQKVPDAMLNIATSQVELGDAAAARRTLDEIVAKYPRTDAATKARARLAGR